MPVKRWLLPFLRRIGVLRYASGGYVRSQPMPLFGERGCDFCIRKSDD